jgi:hypothetical protein
LVRICILANFTVSSYWEVLSNPFFLASFDNAINCGSMPASCFLNCGVMLGEIPLASFSNSALVITVLHSTAGAFAAVPGFAAVASDETGLGVAAHTPFTVITAACGETEAEVSGPSFAGCGGCGAVVAPCPQARVPKKTHISHPLRITHFLQDWSFRKSKMPSIKS